MGGAGGGRGQIAEGFEAIGNAMSDEHNGGSIHLAYFVLGQPRDT